MASTPVSKLGVSESAAGCQPIKTEKVDLKVQADGTYHVPSGSTVDYPDAPPAFGPHWPNFLAGSELRTFYTPEDRPEVERLVHSLEHGHTILWYDDSIKKGSEAYKQIQQIGEKLGARLLLDRRSVDRRRRRVLPQRHARRADPLDRPEGARRVSRSTAPSPAAR